MKTPFLESPNSIRQEVPHSTEHPRHPGMVDPAALAAWAF